MKKSILTFLCLINLFKIKAQSSIWGTYCEKGVSNYTSRNVFYNNGNYFGVLGLIFTGKQNDTFNIKDYKSQCTIVSGKWKYLNQKKSLQILNNDSFPVWQIIDNGSSLADSITIHCKDLFENEVKQFSIFIKLNDTMALKIHADTLTAIIKLPKSATIILTQQGITTTFKAQNNFTIKYFTPNILIPFIQFNATYYRQNRIQKYTINKNALQPNGKYWLYKCKFSENINCRFCNKK